MNDKTNLDKLTELLKIVPEIQKQLIVIEERLDGIDDRISRVIYNMPDKWEQ